jgi:hypothetical protein
MISGMRPVLRPGRYAFCTVTDDRIAPALTDRALASFREGEGQSLVLALDDIPGKGVIALAPMAQVVLEVFSAPDGVGQTAAVAGALADHVIPCNVIAAYHQDHVFVPEAQARQALQILTALQQHHARETRPD